MFLFPWFYFFLQKSWRGANEVADLSNACLSSQARCWAGNVPLHGQRKQGPTQHFVAAWCYCLTDICQRRWERLCCPADAFFFFLILLHCIALKTSSLWVCWEEIPLHLPDLKDGTSKMKRKLDFIGPWPTNSSQCNGTDLCETCETALTRRGRGFNLCSRRHKSPSRGWKMSSNSTAVKSTHYARLRKQQHWKQ